MILLVKRQHGEAAARPRLPAGLSPVAIGHCWPLLATVGHAVHERP